MFDFDLLFSEEKDAAPVWTWYQPADAPAVPFSEPVKEVPDGDE